MIGAPERSAARDAALRAMLPLIAREGWSSPRLPGTGVEADLLFPGGTLDRVEAYLDFADRRMVEAALATPGFDQLRLSEKVRRLIALRLTQSALEKEALRRATALLALPRHAVVAARCLARTVDAIWRAAGDRSADFSWYTKRASLAFVYTSTLLFWLRPDRDIAAALAFLDRRLAGLAQVGRIRRQMRCQPRQAQPRFETGTSMQAF